MPTLHTRKIAAVMFSIALVGSVMSAGAVIGAQMAADSGEDDAPTQDTSYLRVTHASPDAPAVDVYLDNESVLTDVEFGTVSEYIPVRAGTYNVTITAAGDREAVVFDDAVSLDARSVTTVAAAGEVGENATQPFTPILYDDNALEPAENESAISIVHLSPDAPAVDVTVPGENNNTTVLAENVSFSEASDYVTVPAGNYTVEIRAATPGNNGTVVTTADVSLEEGTANSALALGLLEPDDDEASFRVGVTEDVTASLEFPSDEAATEATETPAEEETATEDGEATATEDGEATPTEG